MTGVLDLADVFELIMDALILLRSLGRSDRRRWLTPTARRFPWSRDRRGVVRWRWSFPDFFSGIT
jgi:hypothetical protein